MWSVLSTLMNASQGLDPVLRSIHLSAVILLFHCRLVGKQDEQNERLKHRQVVFYSTIRRVMAWWLDFVIDSQSHQLYYTLTPALLKFCC